MCAKTDQEIVQDCIDAGVPIPPREQLYLLTETPIYLRPDKTLRGQ